MRKLLTVSLLAFIGFGQTAIAETMVYGQSQTLKTNLTKKNFKSDIEKNLDLVLYAYSHTQAILMPNGNLTLNPKLTHDDFNKRIAEMEKTANDRQSTYLYDLIGGIYAAKMMAVNPQGIYDADDYYSKKHIEYVIKCYEADPKNCNVSSYIGAHYLSSKQYKLANSWLEKSSLSGNSSGSILLADAYASGTNGLPLDLIKAKSYYQTAMKQNIAAHESELNTEIQQKLDHLGHTNS